MELTTSWKEEGREEGRREGLRAGEVEVVLRLLRRRFGPLAPEVDEQVRKLSVEKLEGLADALLDFTEITELTDWLGESTRTGDNT